MCDECRKYEKLIDQAQDVETRILFEIDYCYHRAGHILGSDDDERLEPYREYLDTQPADAGRR